MQNQKVLEELGYTPNEAKVYLASLSLGEAQISDLAERVEMPRSTVQVIAERLHEEGLMDFYIMRRHKYWVARDPVLLLEKAQAQELMIHEAIPNLIKLRQKARRQIQNFKTFDDFKSLKDVADGMTQAVLIASNQAEIRYVNRAWEAMFGHECEEMLGKSTNVLKSGKTPPKEYERLWKCLRAGSLFTSEEIVDQKSDGTFFTPFTTIFPVSYGNRTFYVQILESRFYTGTDEKNLSTLD